MSPVAQSEAYTGLPQVTPTASASAQVELGQVPLHHTFHAFLWSGAGFALSCSALAQQQISGLGVEGAPGGSESDWQHSSGAQGSVEAQGSYWLALLEGLWI